MTDHQEIEQAINTWQAELNRVSEEVAAAGMAWLADTTNPEARSRLDAKWDELWQVLAGDQGLALPEGYTLPRPPWNR